MNSTVDFASFNVSELDVLDANDAVALPEMGASAVIIIIYDTPEGDEVLAEADLNLGGSGSLSTSCC